MKVKWGPEKRTKKRGFANDLLTFWLGKKYNTAQFSRTSAAFAGLLGKTERTCMLTDATFSELYHDLAPKMRRWLTATGLDESLAEEFVNEAFLRVWRKQATVQEGFVPAALLWTVLRNLRIDHLRRLRPTLSLEEPEGDFVLEIPAPDQPNTYDESYLHSRIQAAVQTLSPEIRTTFRLFFEDHEPIKTIAAKTGVGESLVKVRIFRARTRLKKLLADLQPHTSY